VSWSRAANMRRTRKVHMRRCRASAHGELPKTGSPRALRDRLSVHASRHVVDVLGDVLLHGLVGPQTWVAMVV
jgi:hypothetical protein